MTDRDRSKGLSLVEILIVVTVVAILALVAFPSYIDHLRKSRRGDAQIALYEIAQRQERFYAQNASYTTDITDLDFVVDGDGFYVAGEDAYYRARALAADAGCPVTTCFKLEAIPDGDQVNDLIQQFQLWSTGEEKKKVDGTVSDGWDL